MNSNNPFAALISPIDEDMKKNQDDVVTESVKNGSEMGKTVGGSHQKSLAQLANELKMNNLLEYIFNIVINKEFHQDKKENLDKSKKIQCVLLDTDASEKNLTIDNIERFVFERLTLEENQQNRIEIEYDGEMSNFENKKLLNYLFQCYHKLENETATILATQQKIKIRNVILNQAIQFLSSPDVYSQLSIISKRSSYLLQLLEDYDDDVFMSNYLKQFIHLIADEIQNRFEKGEIEIPLKLIVQEDYNVLCQKFDKMSLIDPSLFKYLKFVNYFISNINLSKVFISLNFPEIQSKEAIQKTLLGSLLSISCLLRPGINSLEFFLNPSKYSHQEHYITEKNLWMQLNKLIIEIHAIVYQLLKQQETRNSTLEWIELCLYTFRDCGKMWTHIQMLSGIQNLQDPSDGFMLNLSSVLLELSKPFCIPPSTKLLKVDPRLTSLHSDQKYLENKYLAGYKDEAYLISDECENEIQNFDLNFMTRCFFATHKSLSLGFRMVYSRYLHLAHDLSQLQRLYEESMQGAPSDALEMVRERMDKKMNQFLSMKTMLTRQNFVELILHFHIASSIWLNNLAAHLDQDSIPDKFIKLKLPFPKNSTSKCLKFVPEFIVENVYDFIIFLRRFSEQTFALPDLNLEPFMTLILIFMGNPNRMKNPHLRAHLAGMLESLMPTGKERLVSSFSITIMEKLFTEHFAASELVPTLVQVFISIEISEASGEATVDFQEKFGYRRPMYIVLEFLWSIQQHRNKMKELAKFAEENMELITPPLFLQFINFLMNDAIYLLDEALNNMSKLREMQREKESGSWAKLPHNQRQENEMNFQHVGQMARFFNLIGRDTINTLSWLTEEIKTIFCHETLVERMASMLNYFLINLVGPNKKNFKVKDLDEYEFKPALIVADICKIYINLSSETNLKYKEFCLTIGLDDRSYSDSLLPSATEVLIKTGNAPLANETTKVDMKIKELLKINARNEIPLDDVPEEFLDPIMSTLMHDPVMLPSSNVKVDRSTIARHLLSDHTDPFTKAHLTMEMVIPDNELKQKIKDFIDEKLKKKEETFIETG